MENQTFTRLKIITLFLLPLALTAQVAADSDLYRTLYEKDSLMFNVGFNTCDIGQFKALVSEDLEFYHDQSGITDSKEAFIRNTEEGLCKLDYQPLRRLEPGSLRVFPLYDNGVLYGAVQEGVHHFYAKYEGKEAYLTSSARFTHLWLLEEGEWRLTRVLSYDHRAPGGR